MRIGFYNFNGELLNSYTIANLEGRENQGVGGLDLTSSGNGDSVILSFTAKVSESTELSIYVGIIGTDGEWKRGGPIEVMKDDIEDEEAVNEQFNQF